MVGRDKYGVFPLRGKILNVREASHKQVEYIKTIFRILLRCCLFDGVNICADVQNCGGKWLAH